MKLIQSRKCCQDPAVKVDIRKIIFIHSMKTWRLDVSASLYKIWAHAYEYITNLNCQIILYDYHIPVFLNLIFQELLTAQPIQHRSLH